MTSGRFITFEGGEGAGKSSQAKRLAKHLESAGRRVMLTREPGGSLLAERIRALILSGSVKNLGAVTETLLFYAARRDHLEKTIAPALAEGKWVICDRFADSTRAYQGGAENVPPVLLDALDRVVVGGTRPDLTLILDIDPAAGLERALHAQGRADRFEGEDVSYHVRLRQAFLDIAAAEPDRCCIVDAAQDFDGVSRTIRSAVESRLSG